VGVIEDKAVRVGVVGCGKISDVYLTNLGAADGVEVVACADLYEERAREKAAQHGIPKAMGVAELLSDPDVDLVLNLTPPQEHATVALAALREGKHAYNEKPLAVNLEDGRRILDEAEQRGLRVGCAPDTFLGGGLQTCRRLIEKGAIGEPVAATAFMLGHGMEAWHPDPWFFFQPGAGPMFDMGPYYITALSTLIGPVKSVTGEARISFPERTITSEPKYGQKIEVNTPTHVAGVLRFENGAVGTMVTSFDVWTTERSRIEIYGSEGSLKVPDPNTFRGPVRILGPKSDNWQEVPLTHEDTEGNLRGLGVADMARSIVSGEPHQAAGEMGYHVLEVMLAFLKSAGSGRRVEVESTFERPIPLPPLK
jgi:predicted dehydrogenase